MCSNYIVTQFCEIQNTLQRPFFRKYFLNIFEFIYKQIFMIDLANILLSLQEKLGFNFFPLNLKFPKIFKNLIADHMTHHWQISYLFKMVIDGKHKVRSPNSSLTVRPSVAQTTHTPSNLNCYTSSKSATWQGRPIESIAAARLLSVSSFRTAAAQTAKKKYNECGLRAVQINGYINLCIHIRTHYNSRIVSRIKAVCKRPQKIFECTMVNTKAGADFSWTYCVELFCSRSHMMTMTLIAIKKHEVFFATLYQFVVVFDGRSGGSSHYVGVFEMFSENFSIEYR